MFALIKKAFGPKPDRDAVARDVELRWFDT